MLIVLAPAFAGTLSTSFLTDSGAWTGGVLEDGVLSVRAGEASLAPGAMTAFTLTARVRLVDGEALTLRAGDATLAAAYTEGGGLTFGSEAAPLPLEEQRWTPDATAVAPGGAPSIVAFADEWRLYTEVGGAIAVATSTDGVTFEPASVLAGGGTAPEAVVDGDTVVLFSICGVSVCRASSPDGVTFVEEGVALAAADTDSAVLAAPAVAVLADGSWYMWVADGETGATSAASSPDGFEWSWLGAITTDGARLHGLDIAAFSAGIVAAWDDADGVTVGPGGADGGLAPAVWDRLALGAGFAAWSPDAPVSPALLLDGATWTLWAEGRDGGAGVIGRTVGTPTPGTWVGVVLTWDGVTASTSWGEGSTLSAPLTAAESLVFGTAGRLEIDEAQLTFTLVGDDDTGTDTGDSGETGETGGDTGDTAPVDSAADTAVVPSYNASELSGEPGGWGCSTPVRPGAAGLFFAALALASSLCRKERR